MRDSNHALPINIDPNPCLAKPDPSAYRFAVHCCSYKWDLANPPDHAVALFVIEADAKKYGAMMWPDTYEVVDISAGVAA